MTNGEPICRKLPKLLYHGTVLANRTAIETYGLQPRIGRYVENWYGHRNVALLPLILACDKKRIVNAFLAIFSHLNSQRLDLNNDPQTPAGFFAEALLVELSSEGFHHRRLRGDTTAHPAQVERGDYYCDHPVVPTRLITGDELDHFSRSAYLEARRLWNG